MTTHRDMMMAEADEARLRLREHQRARNAELEEWLGTMAPMASVPWQRPARRWGGRLMGKMMGLPQPEAE